MGLLSAYCCSLLRVLSLVVTPFSISDASPWISYDPPVYLEHTPSPHPDDQWRHWTVWPLRNTIRTWLPGLPAFDHYYVSTKIHPVFHPPCSKSSQSLFPQFAYKFTMEDSVQVKTKVNVYNINCFLLIHKDHNFCCRMQSGWSVSICSYKSVVAVPKNLVSFLYREGASVRDFSVMFLLTDVRLNRP